MQLKITYFTGFTELITKFFFDSHTKAISGSHSVSGLSRTSGQKTHFTSLGWQTATGECEQHETYDYEAG